MNHTSHHLSMPNAISYIRFSSGKQGKGSTTERQESFVNEWLAKNPDYELSTLSAKDLGRSAFSGEHLKYGLGAIVRAIEDQKIVKGDVLLVEAVDRLGRLPTLEMITLIQKIVTNGVKIVTLQDQDVYSAEDLNSLDGKIYALVGKIQQAHNYSKNLSIRIAAAYELKRQKARNGEKIKLATPCWLNSDGTLKQAEADAVRACIDLYLRGRGTRRVLLELREIHPCLKTVHPSTVKRWFKSRALIGDWENKGDVISRVFTPLIEESTFYDLRRQLASRTRIMSPEKKYLLSGLVECGVCKSRFHYRRKKHNDYTIIYANCSTYLKRGLPLCGNNKTWPYEVLRFVFNDTCVHWVRGIADGNVVDEKVKELRTWKDKEEECIQRIDALLDLLSERPDQKQTKNKIKALDDDLREIQSTIAQLEGKIRDDSKEIELYRLKRQFEAESLRDDPAYMRDLLEKAGYRIFIDSNVATVGEIEFSVYENHKFRARGESVLERARRKKLLVSYELLNRSTRFSCYLLRKVDRSYFVGQAEEGVIDGANKTEFVSYFAISRTAVLGSSESEEGLIEKLSQPAEVVKNQCDESYLASSYFLDEEQEEDEDEYHHSNLS